MVNTLEEKLLKTIEEDIRSNASLVEERVETETKELHDKRLREFQNNLDLEISRYLESELKETRNEYAAQSSKANSAGKKELLLLREKLVSQLFEEVKEELKKFTAGDDYKKYLNKNLEKIDLSKSGCFYVRSCDTEVMKELLKEMHADNEVKADDFPIGGFRYVDMKQGTEYSCLLDEKRKDQYQWFIENSGFKVKEREAEDE